MKKSLIFCIALLGLVSFVQAQSSVAETTDAGVKECLKTHPHAKEVLHNTFSVSHWVLQLHKASTNEELRKHHLTVKEVLHQQHIVDALYEMLGECAAIEKLREPLTNLHNVFKQHVVTEVITKKLENQDNALFGENTETIVRTKVVGTYKTIKEVRKQIRKMKRTLKL
ncbi:hypothetical protein BKI52_25435 [marine bacterium AO1-C]|nr:hypothetical protein BKI52_25435 [marine bacterium AO1-C]